MKIFHLSIEEKRYLDEFKNGKRILIYPVHIKFYIIRKLLNMGFIELEEDCEYTYKIKSSYENLSQTE